jgi:Secretion system C-terminal sorting domain
MKKPLPMRACACYTPILSLRTPILSLLLWLIILLCPRLSYAQCATAPIAAATCTGGNGTAAGGITISTGQTYWVSGASSFSAIILSGGILRVCGTLNITVLTFNSGDLIVESGGTVNITSFSSSNLNGNVVFINRGTINITSNFTFQNAGNAIYNDLSTSVFNVAGTVTVNSALIVNRGNISFSGLYYQGAAGDFCVQDQSITNIGTLTNVTTNSFAYSGLGSPACVHVSGSAVLNGNLTNASLIHVCQGATATPTGGATSNPGDGWGSAIVTTGCSSCATVLALNISDFTAVPQGTGVRLTWTCDQQLQGNEVFYAEKSTDGVHFSTFNTIAAFPGQSTYTVADTDPAAGQSWYRVQVFSLSGGSNYSVIALVETGSVPGQLQIYPNPAGQNTAITLVIPSMESGTMHISLVDMTGQLLRSKTATLTSGANTLTWSLRGLAAGIYIVRIESIGSAVNSNLYGRIVVRGN